MLPMILYLFHLYDNNTQATFTPTPSQPHRNLASHNLLLTNIQYNSILTIWCLFFPSLLSHILPRISPWLWTGRSWAKSTRTKGWCSIALPAWWRGKKNANWKLLSSHHCPPEATISSFPTNLPSTTSSPSLRYTHRVRVLSTCWISMLMTISPKCEHSLSRVEAQIWRKCAHFPPLMHFCRDWIFITLPKSLLCSH